jgi:hypothetical protein
MVSDAFAVAVLMIVLSGQISDFCARGEPSPVSPEDQPPFKEVKPGIYQLASVKINRRERTVSFPAVMNLRAGGMEYLLVSSWGKVHESILRTETEPYHIHAAMLLLGAKGLGTNDQEIVAALGSFVSHPSNVRLPGDKITITVEWKANGKAKRKRAEELILNQKTKSTPRSGYWVYNGSILDGQSFLAQREGSVVSLVTDPEALINNTAPGHDDDTIWTPNPRNLPPIEAQLDVIIKLVKIRPERK